MIIDIIYELALVSLNFFVISRLIGLFFSLCPLLPFRIFSAFPPFLGVANAWVIVRSDRRYQ